jgi:hypothetical protein
VPTIRDLIFVILSPAGIPDGICPLIHPFVWYRIMKFVTVATAAFLSTVSLAVVVAEESKPGPPFFLIDTTDQLCLAGEEFKRCSINTLWYVQGSAGKLDYR